MDRHHDNLLSFAAVLVVALLVGSKGLGYPTPVDFDGSLMRWDVSLDSPPITYEVVADSDDDRSQFSPVVDEAAAMWSSVPGSFFTFAPVEVGNKAQVTVNLKSEIEGGSYSAGYAIFDEYDETKPLHCAIHVGITTDQSFRAISKTILHELGHCIGLGHTLIPQAIMSYNLSENRYGLDVDDEAAVARLYPIDGSKPRLPPGCAAGSARGKSGLPALAALLLPLCSVTLSSVRSRCRYWPRRRDR